MSGDAETRLRNLLRECEGFRDDLSHAEREDFKIVAEAARREIRRVNGLIRRHCDYHGLAVPRDVLEEDI